MASERTEYRVVTRGGRSLGKVWQTKSLRDALLDRHYADEMYPGGRAVPHRVQRRTVTVTEWEDVTDAK